MTQYDPIDGQEFGPQKANDGVMSSVGNAVVSSFMSGCWGVNAEGGKLCGFPYEW